MATTEIVGGVTVTSAASGTGPGDRVTVGGFSVTNSAPSGDGVVVGAGLDYSRFVDVASVGNAADGIEIAGGSLTEDLVLDDVDVSSNTATGIRMGGAVNVDGLQLINSEVRNNGSIGFSYNSSISAVGLDNVLIEDTTFENNSAVTKVVGSGDVSFFNFNGDAEIRNVEVIGAQDPDQGAHIAFQLRGSNTPTPSGNVVIDNLDISGKYQRPGGPPTPGLGLVVANYTTSSPIDISGLDVDLDVGHALNVWGLTEQLDVGNAVLNASDANSAAILVGTSTQNNVRSNVDNGKAKRCVTIRSIAAGKTGTATFRLKAKKAAKKAKKSTRANFTVTAPIGSASKTTKHRGHVTVLK